MWPELQIILCIIYYLTYCLLLIRDGYFRIIDASRYPLSNKKIILGSKCSFVVRGIVIKLRCSATSYAYSGRRKIYTQWSAPCLQRIVPNSPKLITLWWLLNRPYLYYFTLFVIIFAGNLMVGITKMQYQAEMRL